MGWKRPWRNMMGGAALAGAGAWLRAVRARRAAGGGGGGYGPGYPSVRNAFRRSVRARGRGRTGAAYTRTMRRRRGTRGAALGYGGARQVNRWTRRGRKRVEKKRIDIVLGSAAAPIPFNEWNLNSQLFEMQPGNMVSSYTPATETYGATASAPTQGAGTGQRDGDRIFVKQNQMRICMEKGPAQDEALCCRMLVLQINQDTQDVLADTFVLADFFLSDNITSFMKKDIKYKFKVLVDKTFTMGDHNDAFTDRRTQMNFPMGTAAFNGGLASSSLMTGTGDRIIYGFFYDGTETRGDTLAAITCPTYHGDYKFAYTDQ